MSSSTAKPYHHGNLRAEILQRAVEVIDIEGIEALTLRGVARDLGVSHGAPNRHFSNKQALLSEIAAEGWTQVRDATLSAANETGSDDPHVRLNAMGRGYMRWALNHRPLFRTLFHPDVMRFATRELRSVMNEFADTVQEAVAATQAAGRHPLVPLPLLTLFTNAVPTGAAILLLDPILEGEMRAGGVDQETLIEQVINLVVPLPG
jgi:AcrR family transcriptional regulator